MGNDSNGLTWLLLWCLAYAIHSTLWLGLVWLGIARRRAPLPPAWRVALWRGALCAGLISATAQLGLGIESPLNRGWMWLAEWQTSSPEVVAATAESTTPSAGEISTERPGTNPASEPLANSDRMLSELDAQLAKLEALQLAQKERSSRRSSTAAATTTTAAPPEILKPQRQFHWGRLLMVGLGGIVASACLWNLGRCFAEHASLANYLRDCPLVTDELPLNALREVCAAAGVRRSVQLRWTSADLQPGACGLWQWTILVPVPAREEFTAEMWRALLAHELAHLVRGDQWWLFLTRSIGHLFCWQPLNLVAQREAIRATESLCDALAVTWTQQRWALARCLTQVAEWQLESSPALAGLSDQSDAGQFVRRVEYLISEQEFPPTQLQTRERRRLWCGAALALTLMLVLAPGVILKQAQAAVSRATNAPAPAISPATVTFSAANSPLESAEPASVAELAEVAIEIRELLRELAALDPLWERIAEPAAVARLRQQQAQLTARLTPLAPWLDQLARNELLSIDSASSTDAETGPADRGG